MGFDDARYSEYVGRTRTTVDIDRKKIARRLFDSFTQPMLVGDSQAPPTGREIFIDTGVIL
jgi:DNA-binding LacI/PurR family transcriptional regulator